MTAYIALAVVVVIVIWAIALYNRLRTHKNQVENAFAQIDVQLKRRRVPLTGVYLVSVDIDGQSWPGVANIGVRPTVAGDGKAHLEVHLLDFAGDLYDRRLTVAFHHKLREEQRFASLEALKTAINADVAAARALAAPSAHR